MLQEKGSQLCIALDFSDRTECMALVKKLSPQYCRLKVGKELFTSCGPSIVEEIQGLGFQVFLDLKFHDIPNTVAKAISAAAAMGVWMVNVHASGGQRMMEAAYNALQSFTTRPLVIGVTVLTSMEESDLASIGCINVPQQQVNCLARLAQESGLDGVVCSAHEVEMIKASQGKNFLCVTPGIRPINVNEPSDADDQRRIMSPQQAISVGSDYIVVGRPVTQADDPLNASMSIYKQINSVE